MKNKLICLKCGTVDKCKTVTPGYFVIEIILWCCWLIPGLIYSCWRLGARHEVCSACGSKEMIGFDTPKGKLLLDEINSKTPKGMMTR